MENVDAALGRLLRASFSVDSTEIVAQLKEVVTELKTLRSDSELLTELRAMRHASESCNASLLEMKTSVSSLTTMKTCLESILQMVSTAMEKLVNTPLKNVQILLNSIWLRLAARSTYNQVGSQRLDDFSMLASFSYSATSATLQRSPTLNPYEGEVSRKTALSRE
ncbi:hypothetical protein R1sor_011090 [Riccia sorocarpa]|uniref:Uncharacterized protein n=1 Tax=Riccia sorocarpa TaxID=122646 RepID=A0ABD3I1R1_9MARC